MSRNALPGERCVTSRKTAAKETRNPLAGKGLIVAFYKTVKYICKIVCAPKKKSILKFNSLSNIHVRFWLPVFTSYCPQNTLNAVPDNLIFTISRGSVTPDTSRGSRLRHSFGLSPRWIEPSCNKACLWAWIARSYVNTP